MIATTLLFFLGVIVGFFFVTYVVLALLYGLPKAIFYVAKGRLSYSAIWLFILRVVFGSLVLLIAAGSIIYLFPSVVTTLYNSGGFAFGQFLVIGMAFVYALTGNGRKDPDNEFWKAVRGKHITAQRKTSDFPDNESKSEALEEAVEDVFEELKEAQEIIQTYGGVFAKRGIELDEVKDPITKTAMSAFIPESHLPYSKERIKEAIKLSFLLCEYDWDSSTLLFDAYQRLAQFIPDDEAEWILADIEEQNTEVFYEVLGRIEVEKEALGKELSEYLAELEESKKS